MVLQSDPLAAHVYGTTDSEENIGVEVICNSGHSGEYQGTNVRYIFNWSMHKLFVAFVKNECAG